MQGNCIVHISLRPLCCIYQPCVCKAVSPHLTATMVQTVKMVGDSSAAGSMPITSAVTGWLGFSSTHLRVQHTCNIADTPHLLIYCVWRLLQRLLGSFCNTGPCTGSTQSTLLQHLPLHGLGLNQHQTAAAVITCLSNCGCDSV